jgi:hypothetical protein
MLQNKWSSWWCGNGNNATKEHPIILEPPNPVYHV